MSENYWESSMSDGEPIRIEGVNIIEIFFLEILWSLDSTESLELWKSTLTSEQLLIVEKLQYMIYLAAIDQEVDKNDSFPVVKNILKNFML